MRKKFLLKGLAVTTILASAVPSMTASAAPPVYKNNVLEEVMITKIIPSESYMELTYNSLGIRGEDERPTYSNIQYGEITDYQLHNLFSGKYANTTVVARGNHSAMYFWPSFESGETRPLIKGKQIKSSVDLTKNTSSQMFYIVNFVTNPQYSRIDYGRCTESEVYKAGLATECRMENKGNGLVQYQPYTSEGVRMELTPEEDARLTEATESWRAEPGAWGPEWYVEPTEPNTDEPDDEGETSGEGGDGSGGGSGETGGSGSETSGSETSGETGGEASGEIGGEGGDGSGGGSGETGDNTSSGDNSSNSTGSEVKENSGWTEEKPTTEIAFSFTTSSATDISAQNPSMASGFAYWIPGETGSNGSSVVSVNTDSTDSEQSATFDDVASDSNNGGNVASDDVGVPSLGKEEAHEPNWLAVLAVIGVGMAGLVGWWFLFFGKKKSKDKKGEVKVEA